MGGVLGRVTDSFSYNESDDELPPYGVELDVANAQGAGDAALDMPAVDNGPPGSVSPLMFGGNVFPNGNPSDPLQELMLPLLRRLARNTAQISQTRTVLCPFNINKDSIKLVPRVTANNPTPSSTIYDIQFTFDATEACMVKVFLCVDETFSNGSFEYLDANNGSRVGCVPSNMELAALANAVSPSSSLIPQVLIEKRFDAGLGQTFFTIGAEALDISQFSIANLTWNQLEQQMDADKAYARSGDADSEGSNSDGETIENMEEEDGNDEARGNESGSDDESSSAPNPASASDVIDEEAGIRLSNTSTSPRRNRRANGNKKKLKMPAMPRPKPLEEPLVVRNLYPIVITVEPIIESSSNEDFEKPVVEAQITHACLFPVVSSPTSDSPAVGVDDDPSVASSSASPSAASSSSSSSVPSSSSSSINTKYEARVLRQKLLVNGSVYNAYDIFGVEADDPAAIDSDIQSSCVICMSEPRTTIVMPCRHMCLCEGCAESLKVQSVKCPICRGPVRGLLKVDVLPEDDNDSDNDSGCETASNSEARPKRGGRGRRRSADDHNNNEDGEELRPLQLDDSDDDDAGVDVNEDDVRASLVRGAK